MTDTDFPGNDRHIEVFRSKRTGEPIKLWCFCLLGRDHTYAEWVDEARTPSTSDNAETFATVSGENGEPE